MNADEFNSLVYKLELRAREANAVRAEQEAEQAKITTEHMRMHFDHARKMIDRAENPLQSFKPVGN